MNLELLKDIENEVKRFSNKLKLTKERLTKDNYAHYGCKETGALKRAALDLKMELSKLNK